MDIGTIELDLSSLMVLAGIPSLLTKCIERSNNSTGGFCRSPGRTASAHGQPYNWRRPWSTSQLATCQGPWAIFLITLSCSMTLTGRSAEVGTHPRERPLDVPY